MKSAREPIAFPDMPDDDPDAPVDVSLTITPEQMTLIVGMDTEMKQVQAEYQNRLNLLLSGIVAGHGYGKPVHVTGFDPDKNTLTIVEP